ncbi:MAG: gluconokinase [Rubrobacteraceae bacterium]|nr:gluconokinase [Rubrobacteraceae bacterium]
MNEESGETRVLAVDVGSSSVRASLYDEKAAYVEGTETKLEHTLEYTPDGGAIKDPDDLFSLVVRAVDETLEHAGDAAVAGVAFSTFWHAVLGVDGSGEPTTDILTWADRRSAGAARKLRERLDEREVHRRTGCVLHSSYLPAKLLWLSEEHPERFERTARWISPAEYFYSRFFGSDNLTIGTSMASATGLLDQNEKRWDEELIEALPITEDQLSPISDDPAQGLAEEWAKRWPQLANVPWFSAAGDGACSNIGSGCTTRERLALMVGTSGAMRALWKAKSVEIPDGPWCYRADAERFVMGGALSNGGNLVSWLTQTLRLPEIEEAEKEIAKMEPDSHGLTFLPLLAGERGPTWSDDANGAILGLSLASRPGDILRAALEAVALRFSLIARALEEAIPGEKEVIATGGGLLSSPVWTQIMSDALGRPVTLSGVEEASSRGAALLALERLGVLKLEEAEVPLGETFEPDEGRHEAYREALARQQRLYEAVMEEGGPG